jgi:hypothetical protein
MKENAEDSQMNDKTDIQGEGDYKSAKVYQDDQHRFAESGPVKEKAREAEEALDGPEGEALETARKESGAVRPD